MFATDAINMSREAHGEGCHVEAVSRAFRRFAEAQKFFPGQADLVPIVREITVHEMKGENIVSGRDGSMRGEDRALSHQVTRLGMAVPGGDKFADPFHGQEGGMAFIAMPDGRIDAEGA